MQGVFQQPATVLDPKIILVQGLVKLGPAPIHHFSLNLPATFSQPRTSIDFGPSILSSHDYINYDTNIDMMREKELNNALINGTRGSNDNSLSLL